MSRYRQTPTSGSIFVYLQATKEECELSEAQLTFCLSSLAASFNMLRQDCTLAVSTSALAIVQAA